MREILYALWALSFQLELRARWPPGTFGDRRPHAGDTELVLGDHPVLVESRLVANLNPYPLDPEVKVEISMCGQTSARS
jgi:hypothetical protein